jgi:hypothetical protein
MNNIRSFAKSPRVVKEENPNSARMKKKTPKRNCSEKDTGTENMIRTKAVLEATDSVWNVMVKQSTHHWKKVLGLTPTPISISRTCETNRGDVVRRQKGRVPVQVLERPSAQNPKLRSPARTFSAPQQRALSHDIPRLATLRAVAVGTSVSGSSHYFNFVFDSFGNIAVCVRFNESRQFWCQRQSIRLVRMKRDSVHELGGLAFDITSGSVQGTCSGGVFTGGSNGKLVTQSVFFIPEVSIGSCGNDGIGIGRLSNGIGGWGGFHGNINCEVPSEQNWKA